MKVVPVPCWNDNYAYILICEETAEAGIVDPTEANPVLKELNRLQLNPVAIFNTHHHPDHVGGNRALLGRYPKLKVFGYHSDRGRIPGQTEFLKDGDGVAFGSIQGSFSHNPGHTTGAVTYYFEDCAFTGDTLFAAGCGRLFEGTPEHMYRSLNQTIGQRDQATKVYFGHEYTENNLRFALTVEPNNPHIADKLERVSKLRAKGQFSTPSTLAEEWLTNPFMRCDSDEIKRTVAGVEKDNPLDPVSVLRVVRHLKDRY